jgi:hypothetical protein
LKKIVGTTPAPQPTSFSCRSIFQALTSKINVLS